MTDHADLEVDPVLLVLDVFARADTRRPFDLFTARAAVTAWADRYAALAADPATGPRRADAARSAVIRLERLSLALDVLDAGELDDARQALRHAVLDPIDRSHP